MEFVMLFEHLREHRDATATRLLHSWMARLPKHAKTTVFCQGNWGYIYINIYIYKYIYIYNIYGYMMFTCLAKNWRRPCVAEIGCILFSHRLVMSMGKTEN